MSGYKYSIEFTGGTLMQVRFHQPPNVGDLRSTLDQAGIKGAEITQFGTRHGLSRPRAGSARRGAADARRRDRRHGDPGGARRSATARPHSSVQRTEAVGPKVGGELRQKALYAILISFLFTLAYLALRFEWRFGVAAVIATAHDILATLAFIKYANLEVSLVVVGGILTMIGYSLNDTIIIFDRVRENLRKRRKVSFYDTLNRSVNETLPRSVLTHATVFATLLALAILGGEVMRPFALVMLFGVVTGTFSSIYVAPPLLLWIEKKWPRTASDTGPAGARTRAPRSGAPVTMSR